MDDDLTIDELESVVFLVGNLLTESMVDSHFDSYLGIKQLLELNLLDEVALLHELLVEIL